MILIGGCVEQHHQGLDAPFARPLLYDEALARWFALPAQSALAVERRRCCIALVPSNGPMRATVDTRYADWESPAITKTDLSDGIVRTYTGFKAKHGGAEGVRLWQAAV